MADKYYFAYGSNINLNQMERRCPDATVVEPVVLTAVLVLCTAALVDGSFNPFLYFRF